MTRLVYEQADFDANDRYAFELTPRASGLEVAVSWASGPVGRWTLPAGALERAPETIAIAQGGATKVPKNGTRALPPCLLSRTALADLREGGTTLASAFGMEPVNVKLTGTATLTVPELGTLRVLRAQGPDVELWVVDDAAAPFVLRRTEGYELHWLLLGAGSAEIDAKFPPLAKPKFAPVAKPAKKGKSSRDALVSRLCDEDFAAAEAAKKALATQAKEPGFADWLAETLAATQARVPPDAGPLDGDLQRTRHMITLAVEADLFGASKPLAEACRAIARAHACEELSTDARTILLASSDPVLSAEVLDLLDAPKKLAAAPPTSGLLDAALEHAVENLSPDVLGPKLDALVAAFGAKRRDEATVAIVRALALAPTDAGMVRLLVRYWRSGAPAIRKSFSFHPASGVWRAIFNPKNGADVRTMSELVVHRKTSERAARELGALLAEASCELDAVVDAALEHGADGDPWLFEALLRAGRATKSLRPSRRESSGARGFATSSSRRCRRRPGRAGPRRSPLARR